MTRSLPDLCDAHGDLVQVAEPLFHDYGARRAFGGPITTIKCHEDNALLQAARRDAGPGPRAWWWTAAVRCDARWSATRSVR